MKRKVLITISLLMIVQGLAFAYSDTYYSYKTVNECLWSGDCNNSEG